MGGADCQISLADLNPHQHYGATKIRHQLAAVLTHLKIQDNADIKSAVFGAAVEASISRLGGGALEKVIEATRLDLGMPVYSTEQIKNTIAQLIESNRLLTNGTDGEFSISVSTQTVAKPHAEFDKLVNGILSRAEMRYRRLLTKGFDYASAVK